MIDQSIIDNVFRCCTTCFKHIKENEPHIIAYKNSIPAYFCEEHIDDAKHYLKWFQEFIDLN